ncbi:MAG: FAD-binding oxidoreductase [Actinobacteria bacterium]|nr:FAD-binding oxidoreductase [Actinomycetota bacterium]
MDALLAAELKERFADRVTFDKTERLIYGHDVASLPEAVEMLIDNVPEAVVQPRTAEEVQFLVGLSRSYSVPLVPRGAATTGYGGAVPAKGGIVVDMSWMKRVLEIDAQSGTVTVEPGAVWARLEEELIRHGLMLRLYPTSAPGSTVAGWVAEGGAGIGSYEYGFIGQNVASVTIVSPEGAVRKLSGDDLELVNRAEGITGIIVGVTLLTRPLEDQKLLAAAFTRLEDLSAALAAIKSEHLPLWHVSVSTAEFVRSHQEALALSQNGNGHGSAGHTVPMPQGRHLATFVYPASRSAQVDGRLPRILTSHGAEIQPDQVAKHEWDERFYPMRMKRLGPSLVPSEGILPVSGLPQVVAEASQKLRGIAIEGHLVGPDEITLLCFLPEDERTGSYMIGFSKSLTMLGIIEKQGGRPYSVGLYFTDQAEAALGKEKVARFTAYKKQHDPNSLLNPGKILTGTGNPVLIRTAMAAARVAEPVMGLAEKLLGDTPRMKKNLAENLAFDAFACAQCGYCRDVCTLYNGKRWESSSPRGKWFFLRKYAQGKVEFDQKMVDTFLQCTTCKRCDAVCQVNIPIQGRWDDMRKLLVYEQHHQTFPAFEMMGASFESELNIWAANREERDAWFPADASHLRKRGGDRLLGRLHRLLRGVRYR